MDRFFAAIDGASRGNPGPAGIGLVLTDCDGNILISEGRFIGLKTNNQAEYAALIFALEKAVELKIRHLKVQTDSELLCNQIQGRYRVLNPGLKRLFQETLTLIRRFHDFEIILVSREQNRAADRAANKAINEATKKAKKISVKIG
jgi:ribonuclease HI